MLDAAKPYPAYKDSGQPWLGDVPEHWEVRRLKYCVHNISDLAPTPGDDTPYVGLEHVQSWTGRVKHGKANEVAGQVKRYGRDDVLFAKLRPYLAKVARAESAGVCTGELLVLRPTSQVGAGYAAATLCCARFINWVNSTTFGAKMPRAEWDVIGTARFPVPPTPEQAAIVKVLSAVDRRVNRLVRAKRRLLALLAEQKQAVITQAVTRGLDPTAPTKPSGVPWLGEVPAHWEITRLSAVAAFTNGKAHEQFVDEAGEFVCVTARFVSTGGRFGRPCAENFCPARTGDVLMVMSDLPNGRALARAYFVEEDNRIAVNQRVCRLRSHSINPKFLYYYANRNVQLLSHDDGWNQTHLSNSDFKTMRVLVPPSAEQEAIVSYVDRETRTAVATSNATEREIDLIREYRRRLVADVVTGKLDVRAVAEALPDEAEDIKPVEIDEAEADETADELEPVLAGEDVEE